MTNVELWANSPKVSNEGLFSKGSYYKLSVNLTKEVSFDDILKVLKDTVDDKVWRENHSREGLPVKMDGIIEFLWEPRPWEYPEVINKAVSTFKTLYASPEALKKGVRLPGTWTWNGEKFIQNTNTSGKYMARIGERYIKDLVDGIRQLVQLHLSATGDINPEVEKLLVMFINGWLKLISFSYSFNK